MQVEPVLPTLPQKKTARFTPGGHLYLYLSRVKVKGPNVLEVKSRLDYSRDHSVLRQASLRQ